MSMKERIRGLVDFVGSIPVLQLGIGIIFGSCIGGIISLFIGTLVGVGLIVLQSYRKWIWFAIGIVVISLRVVSFSGNSITSAHISNQNGHEVILRAVVTGDIVIQSESSRVVVEARELCESYDGDRCTAWVSSEGLVQTWIPRYPRVQIGDIVELKGSLAEPKDQEDVRFSYKSYLAHKDIYSLLYSPAVDYTEENNLFFGYRWLFEFRSKVIYKINQLLPEPHASLLTGILLGVKNNMPEDFSEALQRTGTTHVIAASGYNVNLVANFCLAVLKFINRRVRIVLALMFVLLFVLVSGASLPVVRAAIMSCISLIALILGVESNIHVSLILSGALMILVQPEVIKDISFQLSFVSTAGLVYLVPVFESFQVVEKLPKFLKDNLLVTLAAVVSTFPITAYNFQSFSVVALAVNILALPVVEVTMMIGLAVVVMPKIIAVVPALVSWVFLDYFVKVVGWFSKLSFASINLDGFSVWYLVIFYVILGLAVLFRYSERVEDNILIDIKL